MSIKRKFVLTLLLIGSLFLLVSVVIVWRSIAQELQSNLQQTLQQKIINSLSLTDALLSQQVKASMLLFGQTLQQTGAVSVGAPK